VPPRCATVIADASFCPNTKAAGYAIWIKCDGATTRHAGAFKAPVHSAADAETRALANGIIGAIAVHGLRGGDIIVAQTDCTRAIDVLSGRNRRPRKHEAEVAAAVRNAQQTPTGRIEIRFRHVPGHKGNVTPRNAVNEWCDREAKNVMRKNRKAARKVA
jgi:ribonuclease HI